MTTRTIAAALCLLSLPALADEQWPARLVTGGATAGSVMLGPQKLGDYRNGVLSLSTRGLNMSTRLDGSATCQSEAGAYATDGTNSWEPTCFGTFSTSGAQSIVVNPTRGTAPGVGQPPDSKMRAPFLVQARSDGGVPLNTNGIFVNMDVVGGAVSAASRDSTNAVGQLISVRQRPSATGQRPPTAWGHNIDLHIAPGSGGTQTYLSEWDLNNFNADCYAGSDCISAYVFVNGINSYPNTAIMYMSSPDTHEYSGGVTSDGSVFKWASGPKFVRSMFILKIGGGTYRVRYVDDNTLAPMEGPLPVFASVQSYTARNAATHDGILFSGASAIQDNDLHLNTSAVRAVRAAGNHFIAFDTSADSAKYSLTAGVNQRVCLNSTDGCFVHVGSDITQYIQGGGTVLQIHGGGGKVNGIEIASAGTGFGPSIKSVGPDAVVPIVLEGQGGGPTRATTGLVASSLKVDNIPDSSTAGNIRGTLCVDTQGNIFVKTTPGGCL